MSDRRPTVARFSTRIFATMMMMATTSAAVPPPSSSSSSYTTTTINMDMASTNDPGIQTADPQDDTVLPQLTSTTAPGKVFGSRAELAQHYKSPWHTYNVKRRQAGLPPLLEPDFQARWTAAQEALQEDDSNHKKGKKHRKQKQQQQHKHKKHQQQQQEGGATMSSQTPAYQRIKEQRREREQNDEPAHASPQPENEHEIQTTTKEEDHKLSQETDETNTEEMDLDAVTRQVQERREQVALQLDPCHSLFDGHVSATVQDNVAYMQRQFGFFVPDVECLYDLPSLIGYAHEKIQVGHTCLYCQRVFGSATACQSHMKQVQHCKLAYQQGVDLHEWAVFYNFEKANQEFLPTTNKPNNRKDSETAMEEEEEKEDIHAMEEEDDDDEWEDMSENENDMEDDDDDDDVHAGYEQQVAAWGLDVTALGELIFPDGRIIGHRSFQRYYKQRTTGSTTPQQRESVQAARAAARDRLYQGRIVQLPEETHSATATTRLSSQARLLRAAQGRQGHGLLVPATATPSDGSAPSSTVTALTRHNNNSHSLVSSSTTPYYTQFSIYRYRAAVRKQRRQHDQGHRLYQKTKTNINRMDKKHNRLMNGVSVAHAAR